MNGLFLALFFFQLQVLPDVSSPPGASHFSAAKYGYFQLGTSPELHSCVYNLLKLKLSLSKTEFIVLPKPASSWISYSGEGHGHLNLGSEKKLRTKEVAVGMEKGDQGHEIGRGRENPGSHGLVSNWMSDRESVRGG